MNPDKIENEFSYYFFSRSDQFIKDFSFKFEGDFNILVNLFWSNFFLGISYKKLKGNSQFSIFLCLFIFKGISNQ